MLGLKLCNPVWGYDLVERPVVRIDQGKGSDLFVSSVRKDDRFRKATIEHLLDAESLGKSRIVDRCRSKVTGEIPARGNGFVRYSVDFTIIACAGNLNSAFEHVAGAVREPEFKTALEQKRSENRDQDRRNGGDCGEESHETDVQPPAAEAAVFGSPHRNLPCIKRHQGDRRKKNADQEQCDERRRHESARLSAAPQQPCAETEHAEKHEPNQHRRPIIELAACPLPLEPALVLGDDR